jgi:hypothetical protein
MAALIRLTRQARANELIVCVCSTGEKYTDDERAAVEAHGGGAER